MEFEGGLRLIVKPEFPHTLHIVTNMVFRQLRDKIQTTIKVVSIEGRVEIGI